MILTPQIVSVLKKNGHYFTISTPKIVFKDALLFSSPCSLSKYLRQNNVKETKSIFPYTFFSKVEELELYTEFPPHTAFFSELRNSNVTQQQYLDAKTEFYKRKNLPNENPEKINSMRDWLGFYNELDTAPLACAINNSFQNFFNIFGIDPSFCVSLPKFAQQCMFKSYSPQAPLCYSFSKKESNTRELFRNNLTGGLVNVFHRLVDLTGRPDMPHASQFAPNGAAFSSLLFFDFNSLYLFAQKLPFPSTPGF